MAKGVSITAAAGVYYPVTLPVYSVWFQVETCSGLVSHLGGFIPAVHEGDDPQAIGLGLGLGHLGGFIPAVHKGDDPQAIGLGLGLGHLGGFVPAVHKGDDPQAIGLGLGLGHLGGFVPAVHKGDDPQAIGLGLGLGYLGGSIPAIHEGDDPQAIGEGHVVNRGHAQRCHHQGGDCCDGIVHAVYNYYQMPLRVRGRKDSHTCISLSS